MKSHRLKGKKANEKNKRIDDDHAKSREKTHEKGIPKLKLANSKLPKSRVSHELCPQIASSRVFLAGEKSWRIWQKYR